MHPDDRSGYDRRPYPRTARAAFGLRYVSRLVLLALLWTPLRAQHADIAGRSLPRPSEPGLRKPAAALLATGFLAGSLVSAYNDWWRGSGESFHVVDDGYLHNYALGMDKLGHAYTSYFYFHALRAVMRWGGYDPQVAYWVAAGGSALFALTVEVGDGFSPYGFSAGDLAFNMAGLGYGMLQVNVPVFRSINFKWSYVPTDGYRWPPRFTDHYEGHTYWLTIGVYDLLPPVRSFWPSWLHLAVGYGVDPSLTRREWVFGVDIHLGAFRTPSRDIALVRDVARMYHFPAPAVKVCDAVAPAYRFLYTN